VEQIYSRVKNLDEKIKNLTLTYTEWKVLFMVTENTSVKELKDLLKEEEEVLNLALGTLKTKNLITGVAADKDMEALERKPAAAVKKEKVAPAPVEEELVSAELTEIEQALQEQPEAHESVTAEETKTGAPLMPLESEFAPDLSLEQEAETPSAAAEEVEEKAGIEDLLAEISEAPEAPAPEKAKEKPPAATAVKGAAEKITKPEVKKGTPEKVVPPAKVVSDVDKKKIMVIDDSIVIRKMVEIALEGEDYLIHTATNAKDGMEGIEKINPNLIILDMMLPDMNGIEVLKKIKSSRKTPVIMLSGKDAPQLVESAKEVGVDDFLPKPFRDEELVEKVKHLIS
jgi:CheY-like chemotaxis protein